ncbi:MAG: hypothetical protein HZA78_05905 [Candidatus Schekmanbacteria bacterium]|nr:hypothetical protein [Candidatus Schekmanbacteria bacterium]
MNHKFLRFLTALLILCLIWPVSKLHSSDTKSATADLRIKLNLKERAGVNRYNEPITSGVPLPEGRIFINKDNKEIPLRLVDDKGQVIPAQFTPQAVWPDGSLRWVLLDFQASLEENTQRDYYLEQTQFPNYPKTNLQIRDDKDNITVATGAIQFIVNKTKFNILDQVLIKTVDGEQEIVPLGCQGGITLLDEKNKPFQAILEPPQEVKIEEQGIQRAVILIRGRLRAANGELFKPHAANYTVRIQAYNDKDYIRIFFSFENNGRYGFRHEDDQSDSFLFNSLYLTFPVNIETASGVTVNNYEGIFQPNDRYFLFQRHSLIKPENEDENFLYFTKKNSTQVDNGHMAEGLLDVKGKTTGCTLLVRHFWQNFPKALELKDNQMVVHLWPQGEKWPPDAEVNSYLMRGGTHKTYEMLLRFYQPAKKDLYAEELHTAFTHPIMALPSPQWFAESKAMGWIVPAGINTGDKLLDEALARYEKMQRCKFDIKSSEIQHDEILPTTIYTERKARGEGLDWYGWMDFGDLPWGGERGDGAYCSGHYDWPYGMLLNFVRSGDYGFFDLGDEMARHRIDVDQYHSKTGSPWLANFAWNEFGSHERWPEPWEPNPSHTWIKGVLLYHYLTGNQQSKEVALAAGESLIYYWTHDFGDERPGSPELRIQGWSIENLLELYRLTGAKKYLEQAKKIYHERTRPFIHPDGYTGDPRDVNIYQLVLVLEPLIELDQFIHDETLQDDLLKILEFLVKRGYMEGKMHEVQDSVTKETKQYYINYMLPYSMNVQTGLKTSTAPGYNFMVCNALSYAYWITGRPEYQSFARTIFKDAVFYWQEDPVPVPVEKRSPISYAAAHFPGSRTKVHGWINRYPQKFLYELTHPKPDTTPPRAITDLEALYIDGKVILDWTAPGDDDSKGKADRYQIKYSTNTISSELTWLQASHVNSEPAPVEYSQMQKFVIGGLKPGKTYYFAIRTLDEEGNQSATSNVVSIYLN